MTDFSKKTFMTYIPVKFLRGILEFSNKGAMRPSFDRCIHFKMTEKGCIISATDQYKLVRFKWEPKDNKVDVNLVGKEVFVNASDLSYFLNAFTGKTCSCELYFTFKASEVLPVGQLCGPNGKFHDLTIESYATPKWNVAIPHEISDEPARFSMNMLNEVKKAMDIMQEGKLEKLKGYQVFKIHHNGDKPAIFDFNDESLLVLVSPMVQKDDHWNKMQKPADWCYQ